MSEKKPYPSANVTGPTYLRQIVLRQGRLTHVVEQQEAKLTDSMAAVSHHDVRLTALEKMMREFFSHAVKDVESSDRSIGNVGGSQRAESRDPDVMAAFRHWKGSDQSDFAAASPQRTSASSRISFRIASAAPRILREQLYRGIVRKIADDSAVVLLRSAGQSEERLMSFARLRAAGVLHEGDLFDLIIREIQLDSGIRTETDVLGHQRQGGKPGRPIGPALNARKFARRPQGG